MKKLSGGLGKNNIDCLPMEHKISKKKNRQPLSTISKVSKKLWQRDTRKAV